MYRGHWCTANELQNRRVLQGVPAGDVADAGAPERSKRVQVRKLPGRRLKIMTYNLGGVTTDLYDTLCRWLQHNQDVDVLLLQELHWGLGRGIYMADTGMAFHSFTGSRRALQLGWHGHL